MFIGEHSHTIDEKGRLSVPTRFKSAFKQGAVVTRGLDSCLWIYSKSEWEKIAAKLAALPISSKKSRGLARLMLAGAWDAKLDSQGRVVLPDYLRQYARINKHVIVAGLFNRIEVWQEDAWHTYRTAAEANSEEIAEGMADLGI